MEKTIVIKFKYYLAKKISVKDISSNDKPLLVSEEELGSSERMYRALFNVIKTMSYREFKTYIERKQ